MLLLVGASVLGAPFVMLKTARSGSTWMSSLLEPMVRGQYKREFVHLGETPSTAAALEKRMVSWLLAGDSFGINVKNTPCVDYRKVLLMAQAARPRTLLFERCNVVKHAVSYMRVHLVSEACGGPHSKPGGCTVLQPHPVDLDLLRNTLACTFHRARLARNAFGSAPGPKLAIAYESLQRDVGGTLASLSAFLGTMPAAPREKGPSKSGSDDLSVVVSNAAQVSAWLAANGSECLHAQFEERGSQCTPCPSPWPAEERCDQELFRAFHDESDALCALTNRTYAEQLALLAGVARSRATRRLVEAE